MEVLPCSRVAHIARMKKPYHNNIALHMRRNALRVAEVWMDEYKSHVYLAWNLPMEVRKLQTTLAMRMDTCSVALSILACHDTTVLLFVTYDVVLFIEANTSHFLQ